MDPSTVTTFLFTDIEGSSRLWEREPERMPRALAKHDALVRAVVERHRGIVVKMIGDGMHAAFADPLDAVNATLDLQHALIDPNATDGLALSVRCGIHAGAVERRDDDYFGAPVNRAARIMGTAHGGQMLLSGTVADLVRNRLPPDVFLRDLGSVRLRDLATPEEVYQVVHPSLRHDFPALRSLESTPNNLPQQATTFIGREREIADVKKIFCTTRLLTLLGAGGIGKTRLSLQIAADVLEDYSDGVWYVELAPLNDGRLVPQAVALALGVKEEGGCPVAETLVRHVKDRRLLLVLDNCEHLVQACAALAAQLLKVAPGLRILTSSREPLRVSGEACFPVPTLAAPAPRDSVAGTALLQYPAISLFVDRATAVVPAFALNDHNASAVAEICRRLDGIPLAIELAAARVRAFSVEVIAGRLGDRFQLLTGGNRNALPRQQTLRALIDWSYDTLSDKERVLFRRLAVFAGGWTLEAVEAVCSGDDLGDDAVLVLADLVDKSLVNVEVDSERYVFLETIRQYAEERLNQSGEGDATRWRHLAYFLRLAEKVAQQLLGPEQLTALRCLDLEKENVLLAHSWSLCTESAAEQDYRLVHAIKHYWFMRGLLNLGHHVTEEAVARPPAQSDGIARCRALWVAGQICCEMGRYDDAPRYLQESLQTARKLGEVRLEVSLLNTLGWAALGHGDRAMARAHCQEALDLASSLDHKRGIAAAANALAQIHRLDGALDAAEPLYERAVTLGRGLGDQEFTAVGLLNLAMVAIERVAIGRARALVTEVLGIAEQTGSKRVGQSALVVLAGLAALAGDSKHAARFHGAAEHQAQSSGIQKDPADDAFLRPWLSRTREALGDASFAASRDSGYALSFDEAIAEAQAWLKVACRFDLMFPSGG